MGDEKKEWDADLEAVMKIILGKKGAKVKAASEIGKKKVDYFRGKDVVKIMSKSPGIFKKKASKACDLYLNGNEPTTPEDITKLGDMLIRKGFIQKAVYKPLEGDDSTSKRWPDRLVRVNHGFDPEGFYIVLYEGSQTMAHALTALIIFAVLLCCMFPAWPLWAKIGVWYCSVALATLLTIIIIIRLIIYVTFWIIGMDFWIFPNLFDDSAGFLESFLPYYSFSKRGDGVFMLLLRVMILGMVSVGMQQISQTHSLTDITDFAMDSLLDVVEWGESKITMALPDARANVPSLEDIRKEIYEEAQSAAEEHKLDDDDDVEEVVDLDSKEAASEKKKDEPTQKSKAASKEQKEEPTQKSKGKKTEL